MKRLTKYVLALSLLMISTFVLTGCDTSKSELLNHIKDEGYEYYEAIKSKINDIDDQDAMMKEIKAYISKEKFDIQKKTGQNIVLPSKSDEMEKTTILLVVADVNDKKKTAQSVGTALTTYKNKEESQNIKLVIASGSKGMEAMDKATLDGKEVILLEGSSRKAVFVGSVETNQIALNKPMSPESPKGEIAYEILIDGFPNIDSGDRENKHVNPINFIGDVLIRAQSADINIEISDFKSYGDITMFPTGARAVVVIEKSSEEKFEERLRKASEDFQEKIRTGKWEAKMTYSKVEMPSAALNYDDTTSILSTIYTLEDGVFKTTEEDYEGDVLGVFTIASISTNGGKGSFLVMARSADEETKQEMIENYTLTSSILGYNMTTNMRYGSWNISEENKKYWTESGIGKSLFNKPYESSLDLEENEIGLLNDDIKSGKLINVEFDFNDFDEFSYNLIKYIK